MFQDLRDDNTVTLYTGDCSDCNNYRGISLIIFFWGDQCCAQQTDEIGYACLPKITMRFHSRKIHNRQVILAAIVAREM